jgi:nucleotidyltransferase/DNA polymerase involved in DNA repair
MHARTQDAMAALTNASPAVLSGIGRATVDKLAALGARTCADVLAMPPTVLQEKFGATQGTHLKAMARGEDPAAVVFDVWADVDEVPATLQSVVSYGVRPKTQADLDSLVASIVDRLAERLADEDLTAGSVSSVDTLHAPAHAPAHTRVAVHRACARASPPPPHTHTHTHTHAHTHTHTAAIPYSHQSALSSYTTTTTPTTNNNLTAPTGVLPHHNCMCDD